MGKSDPRPMPKAFKCIVCGKAYAMDWAKSNHQKLCEERKRSKDA